MRAWCAPETAVELAFKLLYGRGRVAWLLAICTVEQIVPFAYVASIALREFRAAVHTVACKPFREHTLGKFVIRRTAIESVDVEVALNEETLKLDRRFEVRRSE